MYGYYGYPSATESGNLHQRHTSANSPSQYSWDDQGPMYDDHERYPSAPYPTPIPIPHLPHEHTLRGSTPDLASPHYPSYADVEEAKGSLGGAEEFELADAEYMDRAEKHHVQLRWTNVELSIKKKRILTPLTGIARPGRLFAVMGPSGSGKTSLLHCLAGRRKGVQGDIYLNDTVMTGKAMRHNAGFVPQEDLLFGFLTVEESIRFAAGLQLPGSRAEREAAVEDVIQRSGLDLVR
eukprot:EG_transcript_26666